MSDKLSLIGSLWPVMIAASAYQAYLYFSIKQEIIEKALELNNTIDKDPEALIFNRQGRFQTTTNMLIIQS